MTANDPNMHASGVDRDPAVDRIGDHNRLQLSALMDGELSPDEARFLLRRLEHDDELRGCWERWQLGGDLMRGLGGAVLPAGFAARVADAVALETGADRRAVAASTRPRWSRWGGGAALAASVAVLAIFLVRQTPDAGAPADSTPARVAVSQGAPDIATPEAAPARAPEAPDRAAQLASAVAVADVPRKALARRSRAQSQRAARRAIRESSQAPIAVAASAAPAVNATAVDPFSGQVVVLPNRPWPRALLPGSPAVGAFTVDYGNRSGDVAAPRPFYPFVPRATPAPSDDADLPQRR
ncbi:MAG: sigma-E factor negative regulatory protein [Luteimonas sp.]